ncbi:MAG: universal stress protein [Bacteroidia bacterium]|jgi:nucleotide-binding universal stress UspA family protein
MNASSKPLPYPFKRIAVAVAFSPRIEAILSEAKRLQEIFEAKIFLVHVGKKNLQEEQYLKHLTHRFGLEGEHTEILWKEGDPVEEILQVCEMHQIDLLVAGALEKESLLKYFMGSVARKLCRRAKCSILMLREPSLHSKPIRHIVVEGSDHPKTVDTIETGIYIARQCKADKISVIQEEDAKKLALIRSPELSDNEAERQKEKMTTEEAKRLEEIIKCTDCGKVEVKIELLEGKPGFIISRFAREHHADLLMLNSPDMKLGFIDRVFPHDIEYALADLPCDLLIVHSPSKA